MQQLLENEQAYKNLKAFAEAKYGDKWLEHLDDAKRELENSEEAKPKSHATRLLLKTGEIIEVDYSVTRVKHLRRNNVAIPLEGKLGDIRMIQGKHIRQILPA